jgi:hypothetical protein
MIIEKVIIDITARSTDLVTAASDIAIVASAADNGAYNKSTIVPSIFLIIKEEDELAKACCIICIAINPGAKNVMKDTPNISPLSAPIAKDKTNKNNKDVINGEKSV